jgi:hypothetical protein
LKLVLLLARLALLLVRLLVLLLARLRVPPQVLLVPLLVLPLVPLVLPVPPLVQVPPLLAPLLRLLRAVASLPLPLSLACRLVRSALSARLLPLLRLRQPTTTAPRRTTNRMWREHYFACDSVQKTRIRPGFFSASSPQSEPFFFQLAKNRHPGARRDPC